MGGAEWIHFGSDPPRRAIRVRVGISRGCGQPSSGWISGRGSQYGRDVRHLRIHPDNRSECDGNYPGWHALVRSDSGNVRVRCLPVCERSGSGHKPKQLIRYSVWNRNW